MHLRRANTLQSPAGTGTTEQQQVQSPCTEEEQLQSPAGTGTNEQQQVQSPLTTAGKYTTEQQQVQSPPNNRRHSHQGTTANTVTNEQKQVQATFSLKRTPFNKGGYISTPTYILT